jgi:hypothetical protein
MQRPIGFQEGPELERPVFGALVLGACILGTRVVRRAELAFEQPVDLRVVRARDARRADGREEGREEVTPREEGVRTIAF